VGGDPLLELQDGVPEGKLEGILRSLLLLVDLGPGLRHELPGLVLGLGHQFAGPFFCIGEHQAGLLLAGLDSVLAKLFYELLHVGGCVQCVCHRGSSSV